MARLDLVALGIIQAGQIPDQPKRLSRRKRHIVLAADQWENHASVWFVRRGHSGHPVDEIFDLTRAGPSSSWVVTGGGSGEPGTSPDQRPSRSDLPLDLLAQSSRHPDMGHLAFCAGSGASMSRSTANFRFQAVAEAASLTFSDRPLRVIPDHGCCLIAYHPKRPPTMTVLLADGSELASMRLQGRGLRFR